MKERFKEVLKELTFPALYVVVCIGAVALVGLFIDVVLPKTPDIVLLILCIIILILDLPNSVPIRSAEVKNKYPEPKNNIYNGSAVWSKDIDPFPNYRAPRAR